ncbi:MAG: histidine kinase [Clostridiales bacterium]|nr:histidine kinase [Clostridiales bacterium]
MLCLCIIPVLLLTLLAFGELCVAIYRATITDYVKKELDHSTDNIAAYLEGVLSETAGASYSIYSNQLLRSTLVKIREDKAELSMAENMRVYREVIDPLLASIVQPHRLTANIYLMDGHLHADAVNVHRIGDFPDDLPLGEILRGEGQAASWNVHYLEDAGTAGRAPAKVLSFSRAMYAADAEPLAVISMEIYISQLQASAENMLATLNGGAYSWRLANGQEVFSGGEARDGDWVSVSGLAANGSTLEARFASDLARQQAARQHVWLILVAFALALCAALIIFAITRAVLARIRLVASKFASFDGSALPPPLEGDDEAATLDQTFSRLFLKYRENVDSSYRLQRAMDQMKYHLLLSRINPHFLYNTLSALRWSVLRTGDAEAAGAVDSLVSFYRGVLGGGRDYAALGAELDTLRQYVKIYSFTYSGEISFETDSAADNCLLAKFLLQPVLENAVVHSGAQAVCRIRLSAAVSGERLHISIANSGAPIGEETCARLNALNGEPLDSLREMYPAGGSAAVAGAMAGSGVEVGAKQGGYGVFNVIARIRVLHGDGYGLWHEPLDGGGALARFVLPAQADAAGAQ